jgi:ABC-type bacteriocin/lantibiotic exporter with double-glycine peptidase domain
VSVSRRTSLRCSKAQTAAGAVAYVLRRHIERSRALFRTSVLRALLGVISWRSLNTAIAIGAILSLTVGALLALDGVATLGQVYLIFAYTSLLNHPVEELMYQLDDVQQSGQFSVGDVALFASYLGWMAYVMGSVGGYMTRYQQVGISLQRAVELLQGAPSTLLTQHDGDVRMRGMLPASFAPTKQAQVALRTLAVKGLTYYYPGSQHGVDSVDLRIERGQFVVITGRIGSGKSTLVRALLGLLPRQAGEVRWNDGRLDDTVEAEGYSLEGLCLMYLRLGASSVSSAASAASPSTRWHSRWIVRLGP